jgi:hypothetical protein
MLDTYTRKTDGLLGCNNCGHPVDECPCACGACQEDVMACSCPDGPVYEATDWDGVTET